MVVTVRPRVAACFALLVAASAGCQWIGGIDALELTGDAGVEAGAVDGGSWCARLPSKPTLCADFDEDNPLGGWTTPSSGAGLTIDSKVSDSPPNSLLVQVPQLDATGSAYAGLNATLQAPASEARVEFEYLASQDTQDKIVEFAWSQNFANAIAIVLPPNAVIPIETPPLQEAIQSANGSTSYETPVATSSPQQAPVVTGAWTPIVLTVYAGQDGGPPSVKAQIGNAVWTATLDLPSPAGSALLLRLGGVFVEDAPSGWAANFDNVAVYLE